MQKLGSKHRLQPVVQERERKANVYMSISSSGASLKETKSFILCCFCTTTSSFNPSQEECDISPPQRGPQGTESPEHLQTWYDMEPADHLAAEQSQSPWKRGKIFTGFWVGKESCKIQKQLKTHPISRAQTGIISTQTCIEERDTKVSHLQTREDWKSRIVSQRGITGKKLSTGTSFINAFSEHLCQARDSQNDFPAVLFSGLAGHWNMRAQMLFCNMPSD